MLTIESYKNILNTRGRTLAEVSKKQSVAIIDNTFTYDPNYKRAYVLGKDGWKFEDIKYQFHVRASILKDAVDYYVQFRPNIHYPVGTYIIIPDETSFDINLSEQELHEPFSQPINERTQWWMIVGRDDGNMFVRYNVIKCNWNFKWIYDGKIQECFGAVRIANSYTSGDWSGDYTRTFSNLTSAWIPDTYHCYGKNLKELGLCDTRTILYDQRFMIGNNILQPQCYRVTKIFDITPHGMLKISISQTEYNEVRDNKELMICDYYKIEGNSMPDIEENIMSNKTSIISQRWLNESNELVPEVLGSVFLEIGKTSYYNVDFSDKGVDPVWKIKILDTDLEKEEEYYNNLMILTKYDREVIAIKPSKAKSLAGKHFLLSVSDIDGNYYSSIELEVGQ